MDDKLLKSFLDIYLKYNPTFGSQYGMCQYDKYIEEPSVTNLLNEISEYENWLDDHKKYSHTNNYCMIKAKIKKKIYDITIWKRPFIDPNYYFTIMYNSVFWIAERFPDKNITKAVIKRINQFKNIVDLMIINVKSVPKEYVAIWTNNISMFDEFNIDKKVKNKIFKTLSDATYYLKILIILVMQLD